MIDYQARKQKSAGVATHVMDARGLPGERHRACDMIEQAGGAPRLNLLIAAASDLARKGNRTVGDFVQVIAPALRHSGAVIKARVQVGTDRRIGAMASDRPAQRIDSHDVAGALPDRAEMRIA